MIPQLRLRFRYDSRPPSQEQLDTPDLHNALRLPPNDSNKGKTKERLSGGPKIPSPSVGDTADMDTETTDSLGPEDMVIVINTEEPSPFTNSHLQADSAGPLECTALEDSTVGMDVDSDPAKPELSVDDRREPESIRSEGEQIDPKCVF